MSINKLNIFLRMETKKIKPGVGVDHIEGTTKDLTSCAGASLITHLTGRVTLPAGHTKFSVEDKHPYPLRKPAVCLANCRE